jgi:hypothetical protein
MIPHPGELARDLFEFALMYPFRLLFGDIGAAYYHYHAADDFLGTFSGSSPGEGFLVLVVDIRLGSAPLSVYKCRALRPHKSRNTGWPHRKVQRDKRN